MKFFNITLALAFLLFVGCGEEPVIPNEWSSGVFKVSRDGSSELCMYHYDMGGHDELYIGLRDSTFADSLTDISGNGGVTTISDDGGAEQVTEISNPPLVVINGVPSRLTKYVINQDGVVVTLAQNGGTTSYHLYKKADWAKREFKAGRYRVKLDSSNVAIDLVKNSFYSYTLNFSGMETKSFSYTVIDRTPDIVGDTLMTFHMKLSTQSVRSSRGAIQPYEPEIYEIHGMKYSSFTIAGDSEKLFLNASFDIYQENSTSYNTGYIEMELVEYE